MANLVSEGTLSEGDFNQPLFLAFTFIKLQFIVTGIRYRNIIVAQIWTTYHMIWHMISKILLFLSQHIFLNQFIASTGVIAWWWVRFSNFYVIKAMTANWCIFYCVIIRIKNIAYWSDTVFRQAFLLIQYSFICKQYFFCSDREYQYFFDRW